MQELIIMKKWLWLPLVILGAVIVMGINGIFQSPEKLPVSETIQQQPLVSPTNQPKTEKPSDDLLASREKLVAHVQNLNFQRYTAKERSLTRTYITTQLRKFGWRPQLEKYSTGVNIFAQRPGTDKTAGAILVAAHYDTVAGSPGADDNATGVAVVLEVARLFNSLPTARTLQLAFFDQEEAGLLGSQAFVQQNQHLIHLQGAIIMDMVGYACYQPGCQKYPPTIPVSPPSNQGDFLAVVGDVEHLPLLAAFQQTNSYLPPVLTLPVPFKGLLTPDTLRSDHAPFWYQGVGAVLATDTANLRTPHYHQPTDVPKTIVPDFFQGSAQIIINTTETLLKTTDSLLAPAP